MKPTLLKQYPNNSDVLRLGALTALSLNQVVTAQTRMMQALQSTPMTAEMANTLGNILKAAGEWSQAETAYTDAISLDPNYQPVRSNFIDLLITSGQADRAFAEVKRQINKYGESDFLNFAAASVLKELGRYEEALQHIEKISDAFETAKLAHLKVQICFYLKQHDAMLDILDTIPLESKYAAEALAIIVNAHAMKGDWNKGREILAAFCDEPDAQPSIFVKAIELLTRGGFGQQAETLREKAQLLFRGHEALLSESASHNMTRGRYLESCTLFEEALAKRPGTYTMMVSYAKACLAAGKYQLCQQYIQGALQQAPNSQLLYALGATLLRKTEQNYKQLYDYENFIQIYDLQPPAGYDSIEDFNTDLKNCLERYHSFTSEPLNQSLRLGIQTDRDLALIDDPILKAFFNMIDDPISDYMQKIGYDNAHPLKRRNTQKYRINGAWSVKLSANGHHVNHVHPLGWISSSYYVDVPNITENSELKQGWIKFGEPDIPGLDLKAEKFVQPKGGRLVLFPSYMWHGTIPFSGDQTRMTLPFDVLPV